MTSLKLSTRVILTTIVFVVLIVIFAVLSLLFFRDQLLGSTVQVQGTAQTQGSTAQTQGLVSQLFSNIKDVLIVLLTCASLAGNIVFVYLAPKSIDENNKAMINIKSLEFLKLIKDAPMAESTIRKKLGLSDLEFHFVRQYLIDEDLIKPHGNTSPKVWIQNTAKLQGSQ